MASNLCANQCPFRGNNLRVDYANPDSKTIPLILHPEDYLSRTERYYFSRRASK